jgi:hypothetical protein
MQPEQFSDDDIDSLANTLSVSAAIDVLGTIEPEKKKLHGLSVRTVVARLEQAVDRKTVVRELLADIVHDAPSTARPFEAGLDYAQGERNPFRERILTIVSDVLRG